jgi:hypothetical protein
MTGLIKKLPLKIKKNKVKTGIVLGLYAYLGMINFGTLNTFY